MGYDELFGGVEDANLAGGLDFPPGRDINLYSSLGNPADIDFNLGGTGGIFDAEGKINSGAALFLIDATNSDIFEQFKKDFPEDATILNDPEMKKFLRQQALTQSGQNAVANIGPQGDTGVQSQSADATGIKSTLDKILRDSLGIGLGDAAKYASMAGIAKMAYDDAKKAREEAKGTPFKSSAPYQAVTGPGGAVGFKRAAAGGGIGSLDLARGGRALPPRYLDGHSDGMADKVPAHIDNRRPAALSDGEFVIPADVVSHLGNGNSNAGAKRLYKMMDNIRAARTGNPKQGKQINPDKFLPR
jgi:hypothetical protein